MFRMLVLVAALIAQVASCFSQGALVLCVRRDGETRIRLAWMPCACGEYARNQATGHGLTHDEHDCDTCSHGLPGCTAVGAERCTQCMDLPCPAVHVAPLVASRHKVPAADDGFVLDSALCIGMPAGDLQPVQSPPIPGTSCRRIAIHLASAVLRC